LEYDAEGEEVMSKRTGEPIIEGSGNVFADLGFANPELERLKFRLVQQIATVIERRGLTQSGAAEILGIDQPKVSALLRGRFGGYSTDRLLRVFSMRLTKTSSWSSKISRARAVQPL
jgi:predicted XRE-type DNA-binding protein